MDGQVQQNVTAGSQFIFFQLPPLSKNNLIKNNFVSDWLSSEQLDII